MKRRGIAVVLVGVVVMLVSGCGSVAPAGSGARASRAGPRNVVVWISMDGFRHDYVDRGKTPFLRELMSEGAYSRDLETIVPSITFPSHVAEATGVPVAEHGIPGNDFYDSRTREKYHFPGDSSLLEAEPIWLTAQRQNVRTLVYDWPLSQAQRGAVRCDYFLEKFDGKLTDQERLERLLKTWRADRGAAPLQLLMGYIKESDTIGHKYGPDSPQLDAALARMDGEIRSFVEGATAIFREKMRAGDSLYIILTTDHGMMRLKTLVNPLKLFSHKLPESVVLIHDGPVAMFYLREGSRFRVQGSGLEESMLKDLARFDFLTAYRRKDLPEAWHFAHPMRVGDIVVMLKPGYSFSERVARVTFSPEEAKGPMGMHGYPPNQVPEMLGFCVFWRADGSLGGKDLGTVSALQLHPTVAKLLGISPAADAKAPPLKIH